MLNLIGMILAVFCTGFGFLDLHNGGVVGFFTAPLGIGLGIWNILLFFKD